ncbi:centromere-associated protein E-like [Hibiscus syriacus]|uniref:centromere-associated protein E-like n=1 Tax=Hibiscus syriacus TaxID=106335 RepID=UPI0019234331|nr:centromere-associated protein E-like [Hibiscus syriacus]
MSLLSIWQYEEDSNKESIESLKKELEESKESERKLQDLLLVQTKELEKTKVSLEESRIEIKSLLEKHESSSEIASQGSTSDDHSPVESLEHELRVTKSNLAKTQEKAKSLAEEVMMWKNELRRTIEAEDNNKKAMDGLASALQEVIIESNQTKDKLSSTEEELKKTKKEVEELKVMLKKVKDQCVDERREADRQKNIAERLRAEAEESIIAWSEQQKGFVECIKKGEFEKNAAREECKTLKDSLKEAEEANNKSRDEIHKLRDIMRQALTEANVAKEAAIAAKEEISKLKDALAQKEEALKLLNQENERRARSKASARSKSPARRTALMTMKQYSEMDDSEQCKEHIDHDKGSEQPTLRPRRSPSPLPVLRRTALLTVRQCSEMDNSEHGKEHNDHDHEGEHPTLPKRPPSPSVARRTALLTIKQYPEMENFEQGKEHNDHDKEVEQPTLGPKRPPSPIRTMRKAMLMTMKHYKEHNDHDKENEQSAPRPSRSTLVLPTATPKVRMSVSMTNLKLCSELEDSEHGKKQKPTDSTQEHSDHDKEIDQSTPRLSRSIPALPATMTAVRMSTSMTNLKLCSEMEDSEQGKKQKPMDSTRHDKERKDHDKRKQTMCTRITTVTSNKDNNEMFRNGGF